MYGATITVIGSAILLLHVLACLAAQYWHRQLCGQPQPASLIAPAASWQTCTACVVQQLCAVADQEAVLLTGHASQSPQMQCPHRSATHMCLPAHLHGLLHTSGRTSARLAGRLHKLWHHMYLLYQYLSIIVAYRHQVASNNTCFAANLLLPDAWACSLCTIKMKHTSCMHTASALLYSCSQPAQAVIAVTSKYCTAMAIYELRSVCMHSSINSKDQRATMLWLRLNVRLHQCCKQLLCLALLTASIAGMQQQATNAHYSCKLTLFGFLIRLGKHLQEDCGCMLPHRCCQAALMHLQPICYTCTNRRLPCLVVQTPPCFRFR